MLSFCCAKERERKETNVRIIKLGDKEYPQILLNIYDPPKQLYVLGNEEILNGFGIAIVGSRNPTKYGEQTAKSLSYNLTKNDITVISGMAKGIDAAAHTGCLMGMGKTIAVLGSGFNHIYPKENIGLFKKILENGGAVITEYEPDMPPNAENFPKRNRIISGLSQGVVVVEARERSGSLITAELALEQGKEIFAVPGNISSQLSRGTNELIKDGAKIVTNVFDILEDFS